MKNVFSFLMILLIMAGCSSGNQADSSTISESDAATLKSDLDELEAFFKAQPTKSMDQTKANQLIEKSRQYVEAFPNDPIGGFYLFRAGEVARAIGQYEEAIVLMSKVEEDYPNHEKAAPALFLKGFTYEENLKDVPSAKKYYNAFLKKYPKHALSKQVKQLLEVIDTPPEELVKRFKQQQQQQQQ